MLKSTATVILLTAFHFLPIAFGMRTTTEIINVTPITRLGCSSNPCGTNAICRESYGRPLCSCPPGCSGSPFINCRRDECLDNNECPGYHVCHNGGCVNPCDGACAANAICYIHNHEPVCSCPKGYDGDPTLNCSSIDEYEDPCQPSPCGINATCKVQNDAPTCSCLPGYVASPSSGCRRECEYDDDCSGSQMCANYKCIPACKQCGKQALCLRANNHRAVCGCPKGYMGNPYLECKADDRPACINGTCKNTCDEGCKGDSECRRSACNCPQTNTGNPFFRCRNIMSRIDPCTPNPCGENTECNTNRDITDRGRPICTCLPGYTEITSTGCGRECLSNDDCDYNRVCIGYSCVHRWIFMS